MKPAELKAFKKEYEDLINRYSADEEPEGLLEDALNLIDNILKAS